MPTHLTTQPDIKIPTDPINPAVRIRDDHGLSRNKWSQYIGHSFQFITQIEHGCYPKLPTSYAPYMLPDDRQTYDLYRYEKRRLNFTPYDFPADCTTMQEILEHNKMTYNTFAFKACVQPGEVFRLATRKRALIPHALREFFSQIGVDKEWIANLQYVTVKMGTAPSQAH